MLRAGLVVLGLLAAMHAAQAAPIRAAFDHDQALRDAGYRSLGSLLLPISRGLSAGYLLTFGFDPGSGEARFELDGAATALPGVPAGSAIGFRLIAATEGEAEHAVDAIPFAETLSGGVDPLAIGLLLPAVQTVRSPPPTPPGGDGPVCEPPPEPVCQAPPGGAPFGPVEWLAFDFAEPLLALELAGAYAFRPASAAFGPNDMALEIHYLRRAPEPASLVLFGAALAVLLGSRRAMAPQPS